MSPSRFAQSAAVAPRASFRSVRAPASRSSATASMWPPSVAIISGVILRGLRPTMSRLAPRRTRSLIAPRLPAIAAQWSGGTRVPYAKAKIMPPALGLPAKWRARSQKRIKPKLVLPRPAPQRSMSSPSSRSISRVGRSPELAKREAPTFEHPNALGFS